MGYGGRCRDREKKHGEDRKRYSLDTTQILKKLKGKGRGVTKQVSMSYTLCYPTTSVFSSVGNSVPVHQTGSPL